MYIVTEVQVNQNNEVAVLNSSYDNYNQAVSKYHTVLAAAAISNVDRHGAFLYTEDGYIAQECYKQDAMSNVPVYIVTEIQLSDAGAMATLNNYYLDRNQALSKYYTVLAAAAISSVYKHACFMYSEDSYMMHECFSHIPEPEPEPEEPETNEGE